VAHGPRKEPLDFGGNLNHVTQCLFNSNNSRTSSALVKDMLSILSAILIGSEIISYVVLVLIVQNFTRKKTDRPQY